jgi:NADPH:quinone reductase
MLPYPYGAGSHAEYVTGPTRAFAAKPAGIDHVQAAALPLAALTAWQALVDTADLRAGQRVLIHAAAGGVGLLLVQLAKAKGARVIATVSTVDKEKLAREAGADEVIRYTETDFATETRRLTDGAGVQAVYDGVGRTTFDGSLASLAVRGMLVLFGASSGPVPPVDPQRLNAAGSVYLTRPTSGHYTATPEELRWRAGEVYDAVAAGQLSVRIGARYPLAEARRAHEDLQGRRTTGKLLLIPR